MRALTKLLGKSPFAPLKAHMEKVGSCIDKLNEIFAVLDQPKEIEKLAKKLSELEYEADITKNDLRNHLKGFYLVIDQSAFLDILSLQDDIADKAEDIAILLTLHPLHHLESLNEKLQEFYAKNVEAFRDTQGVMGELDDLVESSFGGIEAEKVRRLIEKISHREYEADVAKQAMLKELFDHGEKLSTPAFYQWIRLIEEVGIISHASEKLANRIRMTLEIK